MMETVDMVVRSYERVLSYEKKKDNGKSGWSDEIQERTERSVPYIVRDEVTITMDEMHWSLIWMQAGA